MSRFNKAHRMSFTDQKREHEKIRRVFYLGFALVVFYLLLVNFFFSIRVLENASMNPGLAEGDRFVFLSFNIYKMFPSRPFFDEIPLKRGNIVLVDFTERRPVIGKPV